MGSLYASANLSDTDDDYWPNHKWFAVHGDEDIPRIELGKYPSTQAVETISFDEIAYVERRSSQVRLVYQGGAIRSFDFDDEIRAEHIADTIRVSKEFLRDIQTQQPQASTEIRQQPDERWWRRIIRALIPFHRKPSSQRYPANWDVLRRQVYARDGHRCVNCRMTGVELHAHHIVPLSRGGTNNMTNLITLCRNCHESLHPHMRSSKT